MTPRFWRELTLLAVMGSLWVTASTGQAQWQMQGGRMQSSVVVSSEGERARVVVRPGEQVAIPAGDCAVNFPRNADGKPASLQVPTSAGARVNVGVAGAVQAASKVRLVDLDGEQASRVTYDDKSGAAPLETIIAGSGDAEAGDYRVSATVNRSSGCGAFGVVARYGADRGFYLFCIDWSAQKVRLERWLGKDRLVVRQVDASWLSSRHRLTLQVAGFRVECSVDDEVVIHSFDGALTAGHYGVGWVGDQPAIVEVTAEPVADPLPSAALVQSGNRARLFAAAPAATGHLSVLQLSLDRPHAYVLQNRAGLEPALMQAPAAPIILWGDWRNSPGPNSVGEIGFDGRGWAEVAWPDLPGLRGQVALARLLLVTPDGSSIVGSTPSVAVVF